MEPLKQVTCLYIDDLFKCGGEPTSADKNFTFELLNYRYNNQLPTVISTELTPRQLGVLDGAVGSRIVAEGGYVHTLPLPPITTAVQKTSFDAATVSAAIKASEGKSGTDFVNGVLAGVINK